MELKNKLVKLIKSNILLSALEKRWLLRKADKLNRSQCDKLIGILTEHNEKILSEMPDIRPVAEALIRGHGIIKEASASLKTKQDAGS